jgi:shikimate 5-dehydrogenase
MKKFLVIGNPIEHSLSPYYIIIGLKIMVLMQFMKKKIK